VPSGLVAVVVPSLCRVRVQPHRWIAVRWWKPQRGSYRPAGSAIMRDGAGVGCPARPGGMPEGTSHLKALSRWN
jgi:hypothetical protein